MGENMIKTRYDSIAIIPRRCDVCHNLFWLQPFNVYVKEVGIEHDPINIVKCKKCCNTIDNQ